jgi:plastocyanin
MRPEDGVASPAQLDGQAAMYERRRLIDEVIKTGVPAAAAAERDRSNSGALAVLYLLIPLLVIGFLIVNGNDGETTEGGGSQAEEPSGGAGAGGPNTVVAADVSFETDELEAEAGGKFTGTLDNQDSVEHNIAFYMSEDETSDPPAAFYTSDTAAAGSSVDFEFTAPEKPGDYPFVCDFHPTTMTGTLVVSGGGGGGGEGEGGG